VQCGVVFFRLTGAASRKCGNGGIEPCHLLPGIRQYALNRRPGLSTREGPAKDFDIFKPVSLLTLFR
jgi:hypothetical protein